jgi:hypothetical protein
MGSPYALFAGMLRLMGWLNGLAALLITAFALGAVGSDVDPPDLSRPLDCFLVGLAAAGVAMVLAFVAQLWREHRLRQGRTPGGRLGLALALLAFAVSVAGFGAGCWFAVDESADDSSGGDVTSTLYAHENEARPVAVSLRKKLLLLR